MGDQAYNMEYEEPTELEALEKEIENLKGQLEGVNDAGLFSVSSDNLVKHVISKEEKDPFVNPTLTDEAMWAATLPVPRPVVPEVTEEKSCCAVA